jgi:glycosyltransferase involved in cell wall biosynthesis
VKILGIDKTKIKTIYSGVDDIFLSPTYQKNENVKQKYVLPPKYILAVGTREPRKNLSRLIQAFHKLKTIASFTDYSLVIVGNYGWGKDIEEEGNIKLIGYVQRDEMPSVYAMAEIFAYPSLYEGFGLPILEAMKSGCPVMTSNIGSMKEISDDCAVFADPNDVNDIFVKLKDILTVPKFKKSMIEKGKNHASEFSWKKTAAETLNYYKYISQS